MAKFQRSTYLPKNKEKYIGQRAIICRSSWERTFCMFLDNHPSILQWASEPFPITYRDPLTNKQKQYWPDIFMIYVDQDGIKHGEVIEIKPSTQTGQRKTKSAINNAQIIRNQAKFAAALQYCELNGIGFRIITELEMFKKGTK
jgi:hypothetical protein